MESLGTVGVFVPGFQSAKHTVLQCLSHLTFTKIEEIPWLSSLLATLGNLHGLKANVDLISAVLKAFAVTPLNTNHDTDQIFVNLSEALCVHVYF